MDNERRPVDQPGHVQSTILNGWPKCIGLSRESNRNVRRWNLGVDRSIGEVATEIAEKSRVRSIEGGRSGEKVNQ